MRRARNCRRRGVTMVEVLVALACGAALVAFVVPVVANVATASGEARSLSNLRILSMAHDAYANTYAQRQLTFVQEDAGLYAGNCLTITCQSCPPQLLLGQDPNGAWWGYYLGSCQCAGFPGSCGNWSAYKPIEFFVPNQGFGAFRLGNAHAFNAFVEGRFYSDTFYAPNDALEYQRSAKYRDQVIDFSSTSNDVAFSSYCMSPAAMWHPDVLSDAYGGYRDPNTFIDGYASPTVTQCLHPDLKTRLIEHNWCDGAPSMVTSNTVSSIYSSGAYTFNSSASVAPLSLFFDGHIARLPNSKAIADDQALFDSSGLRLWSRTTPLGENGYYVAPQFDDSPRTSHTILTTNGILGRDVLTAE